MNHFAIYTAVIGSYDEIQQPEVIDKRFDYILFSDSIKEQIVGVWRIKRIDYTNDDKIRIARYVKTHSHTLLADYDATLWIDANIRIKEQRVYDIFIHMHEKGVDIASIKHFERDCIYDEAYELINLPWEHDTLAFRWCSKIRKEHYPRHNGLYETNILYRRQTDTIQEVNELWWKCIEEYSRRDQLSFNYVLWRLNIAADYFLPQGEQCRNSASVEFVRHTDNAQRKVMHLGYWENLRFIVRRESPEYNQRYRRIYWHFYMLPYPLPLVWLYLSGLQCYIHLKYRKLRRKVGKILKRSLTNN